MPVSTISTLRAAFPIFDTYPNLAYMDNAATTQKPAMVIDGIENYYRIQNANIHRGVYPLSANTTVAYEKVRQQVAAYINAPAPENIVYTSGTTAAINLVAYSFLAPRLQAGDDVLISAMEHHANLIPWQQLCKQHGAHLRIIPLTEKGTLDLAAAQNMLSPRTRMMAVVHISNTLGTINPVAELIDLAHRQQVPVLIDAAQSAAHYPIDVQALQADFLCFSGHKLYGPTGIGILYGKSGHLEAMLPLHYGGDSIRNVSYTETLLAPPPTRFEAGTQHIAGVIGLGYALHFLNSLDKEAIRSYFDTLTGKATAALQEIDGLRIIGPTENKAPIISFTLAGVHPHDIATFLGAEDIAIRAGHHCTQPLLDHLGVGATCRASFGLCTEPEEIDRLTAALLAIKNFFV